MFKWSTQFMISILWIAVIKNGLWNAVESFYSSLSGRWKTNDIFSHFWQRYEYENGQHVKNNISTIKFLVGVIDGRFIIDVSKKNLRSHQRIYLPLIVLQEQFLQEKVIEVQMIIRSGDWIGMKGHCLLPDEPFLSISILKIPSMFNFQSSLNPIRGQRGSYWPPALRTL